MPRESVHVDDSLRPRTRAELRNERGVRRATKGYRQAHRGVWVPEGEDWIITKSQARLEALTSACPEVVATGWLAADINCHPWPPSKIPLEVATLKRHVRREGVTLRRYEIPENHIDELIGPGGGTIRVASNAWSLFDIARYSDPVEAVVALDGSWKMRCDAKSEIRDLLRDHPHLRNKKKALAALDHVDLGSESPWETRTRLFLREREFDCFVTQHKVPGLRYRLDLAAPQYLVAVEYDGAHHLEPEQHAQDLARWNRLRNAGWIVFTVTARMLRRTPDELTAQVDRALRARGWPGPGSGST